MRNSLKVLLIALFIGTSVGAQVKIGDNPQNIDPASVLELESTDKVLVITRVTTAQMNTIVPSQGALCFNTDLQSVHYYDGAQWVNIGGGGGTGGPLTADPIVNDKSTIVITPTATGNNLEVAPESIGRDQIENGAINSSKIQDNSIGPGKLLDNSVTQEKLSENSVGAFALDNDNIGLSAFNNDINNITAGNLISVDPDNVVTAGPDGGVFYDDTILMMDIADVSQNINDHILADDDLSDANEIQNLTLNGTEIGLTDTAGTVDIGPLISAGGSDDQNLSLTGNIVGIEDGNTIDLTPILGTGGTDDQTLNLIGNVIGIEDGNTVDLTPILGAGGSDDQTAAEVTYDNTTSGLAAANTQAAIDELAAAGSSDDQTAAEVTYDNTTSGLTAANTQAAIDELAAAGGSDDQTAAEVTYDNTTSGLTAANTQAAIDELAAAGGSDDQTAAEVTYDNTNSGLTAANAQAAIDEIVADHIGTENEIFFADATGAPTGNNGLIWNPTAINNAFPALGIGLDGGTQSTIAKVHIAETLNGLGDISYGLQIQNRAGNNGNAVGIIFAVDPTIVNGKGALLYERTGAGGIGDFHFLQSAGGTGNPVITDKALTITNDKHIGLYGGIDIGGDGTGFGTTNQVLASDGPGNPVKWVDADGDSVTDDDANDGLSEYNSTTGYDVNVDDVSLELLGDALQIKNNGVSSAQIALNTIGADDIDTGAVTSDEILNATILAEDLSAMGATSTGQVLKWDGTNWGPGSDNTNGTDDTDADDALTDFTATSDYDVKVDDVTIEIASDALQIKNDGVSSAQIALNTIVADDINTGAVTSDEILNATILSEDLSAMGATATGQVLKWDGTNWGPGSDNTNGTDDTDTDDALTDFTSTSDYDVKVDDDTIEIANDALQIKDAGVVSSKIAPNAITTDKIADGEVTVTKLAIGSVQGSFGGTSVIVPASIGQLDIGNNAIGSGEIQSDAVSSDEIDDESINNIDISTTAAIDGTKINPDFGGQNIVTSGNLDATDVTATGNLVVGGTVTVQGNPVHPDYVFQKYFLGNSELKLDYDFASLEEIEVFIKNNHHLPGIKSAAQVKKEGAWNLSNSNIQNLEKIEELFLHTIEQEKKIKSLKSENQLLKEELESLQNSVEEIKLLLKTKE